MANTVTVQLNTTSWVQVADTSGFVTNGSKQKIIYREAATAPANSVNTGHLLDTLPGDFFQFTLSAGQEIYARSIGGPAILIFTPEG